LFFLAVAFVAAMLENGADVAEEVDRWGGQRGSHRREEAEENADGEKDFETGGRGDTCSFARYASAVARGAMAGQAGGPCSAARRPTCRGPRYCWLGWHGQA
jgi:hypothetical protein